MESYSNKGTFLDHPCTSHCAESSVLLTPTIGGKGFGLLSFFLNFLSKCIAVPKGFCGLANHMLPTSFTTP